MSIQPQLIPPQCQAFFPNYDRCSEPSPLAPGLLGGIMEPNVEVKLSMLLQGVSGHL